jgi:hypothetical protein
MVLLRFGAVCGECLALGPAGLVAVGKVNTVLVVEGSTGEIRRTITTSADPLDVIFAPTP